MSPRMRSVVSLAVIVGVLLTGGAAAVGARAATGWQIKSVAAPSNFSAGDCAAENCDGYQVLVTNVGASASNGPIIIKDKLPEGLKVVEAISRRMREPGSVGRTHSMSHGCTQTMTEVVCEWGREPSEEPAVPPEGTISFRLEVEVEPGGSRVVSNGVEVEEEGVLRAVGSAPGVAANTVNGPAAAFGVGGFLAGVLGGEGMADVQAGGHPALNTTSLDWNTEMNYLERDNLAPVLFVQEPKSEVFDLPAGFVGDPQVVETCSLTAVNGTLLEPGKCPADSQVGYVSIESAHNTTSSNLYNVPPEAGYPAEFAFEYVGGVITLLPRLLPSGEAAGGYVLSVAVPYIPKVSSFKLFGATAELLGVPSERDGGGSKEAFLTNPDDCAAGPQGERVEADSWVDPGRWVTAEAPMFEASSTQGVSGCGGLEFHPSVEVTPETSVADTPSGYEVDVRVPQAPSVAGELATPDLKDTVVSLPEGVSVSPGAANGLVACQSSGGEGIELGVGDRVSDGNVPQEGEALGLDGLVHPTGGHCPAASEIGEVEVLTPLLAEPLKGHVFVVAPSCGGEGQPACTPASAENGELFGLFMEVGSEATGLHVKLHGVVSVSPVTGRSTTRFTETPEMPFSELKLRLNGGAGAPLSNPQSCGSFMTASDFTPWSTPYTPDATPSSSFAITSGCANAFAPGFTAGAIGSSAGAYHPFTLTFSRGDGEQDLAGLTVGMPAGLTGAVAGVTQCGVVEVRAAEAGTGSCPAGSRVGTSTAAAGAGSAPFWQSGPVYLTGPYNGAPFGLAVVVAANAGPFHLGNIVVRAAIHINPVTDAVTVVSNPLPQMVDGVPLRIKTVNVTVGAERAFTRNPTSCVASSINATITSAQGVSVPVSTPFQATGCAALPFRPVLTVSTGAVTSKANGASLVVRVTALPGEADIAKTDLQLPLALPSRLTTLQKACTEAQFDKDPAGCPEGSDIGMATAKSPLLNVPLTGPMYLVSHGGAAFPDVEIILQGEGVETVLDGKTDIKKGITYSNFESVPDEPVSSFEAVLPEGPHSALTTAFPGVTNLCAPTKTVLVRKKVSKRVGEKLKRVTEKVKETKPEVLVIPTRLVGQNGAVVEQSTKVTVTGCAKPKPAVKKAKASKKAKATRRAGTAATRRAGQ